MNLEVQLQLRELAAASGWGDGKKRPTFGAFGLLYHPPLRTRLPPRMPFPPSTVQIFCQNFPLPINKHKRKYSVALRCPNHQMTHIYIYIDLGQTTK